MLEVEMQKYNLGYIRDNIEDNVSELEESPMVSFMNKMNNKRGQPATSTPSPRSRASFTEESPHFARDGKNFTPSSKGKNSGCYKLDVPLGHVLSFGGNGQNFFMAGADMSGSGSKNKYVN